MKIAEIRITHHQLPLDPPFPASWDTAPRRRFPATIVRVFDDQGRMGIGSGDAMVGFQDYAYLFLGQDPRQLQRHAQVLENINFHAGRCWPLEAALWDLAGQIEQQPVWRLLHRDEQAGDTRASRPAVAAYASFGTHRTVEDTVAMAQAAAACGFTAIKLRFGRPSLADDLAVVAAVRSALGDRLKLLVDCNQGWRMPWDTQPPWEYAEAREVAQELAHHGVYWMEEPLHRANYAGMARLRGAAPIKIAGGEGTREISAFATLLERECLDVYQPDVVWTGGMFQLRDLAYAVAEAGCIFTPHTWGNGIGLLANLHLTAGTVGAPFLEFPWDPPLWTNARRDFMLAQPIEIDAAGRLTCPAGWGLGIVLDEDALARTETAAWRQAM
jgi:L-alanine-DL-glutamate epimerase-like enolase superfamily enzyme